MQQRDYAATERGFAQVQIEEKSAVAESSLPDFSNLHASLVQTFDSGVTRDIEWRRRQLQQIQLAVRENYEAIGEAVRKDHGGNKLRGVVELDMMKVAQNMLDNLDKWAAPQRVKHTEMLAGRSEVRAEPKGVVLLIAPWNYPITLCFRPLCAVIAAGNCCVVKPSEVSSHSAKVVEFLINKYLDPRAVRCVLGEVPETTALLRLRWDHIVYTGNGGVGRIVMRAAAEHLTPTTLELGGKSPTIICESAKMAAVVARVGLAKFGINAGQTCIAPDYILVHRSREDEFNAAMSAKLRKWFADSYDDYGNIINTRHVARVGRLLENSGGELTIGGSAGIDGKHFPPTMLSRPSLQDPVMQEEIFGPVLPVLPFDTIDEAIAISNRVCKRPLALYVFSEQTSEIERVITSTQSGGVCVNSAIEHNINYELPFGGIGESGMGAYNGKWGFDEFSHHRGVLYKDTTFSSAALFPGPGEMDAEFLYNMAVKLEITGFLSEGQKTALKVGLGALAAAALYKIRSRL